MTDTAPLRRAQTRVRSTIAIAATASLLSGLAIATPAAAATYSISGTVTLPPGAPLEWYEEISVWADDQYWESEYVDPTTGEYEIILREPGDYAVAVDIWNHYALYDDPPPNVYAQYWPGVISDEDLERISVSGAVTGIDFDLELGSIVEGTVTVPEGADDDWHEDVQVYVSTTNHHYFFAEAVIDPATGRYRFVGLAPQDVIVSFLADLDRPMANGQRLVSEEWENALTWADATVLDLRDGDFAGIDADLAMVPLLTDVPVWPGPGETPFHTEISWFQAAGITTGYAQPDGTALFRPFGRVTRDAMAAFLYRYAGSPDYDPPAVSPFTDVTPASSAFYTEICWLAEQGITTGWSVGGGKKEYRPYSRITRDAMAAFLYRFSGSPAWTAPKASPFVDVSRSASFYKEITWLADTRITTGWSVDGEKEFRPFARITRDAMAAFIFRHHVVT